MSLSSGRTAQYKHNAKFLRHFCLHGDVNDAHRAGANRLKKRMFQHRIVLKIVLTKASAKADNLITSVKIGRLLDVDIHPNFRTLMKHKAFLSTWCRTYLHTTKNDVFFLDTLKVSLAPILREEPFHVMFLSNEHSDEQNELNLCEFESQNATTKTHALISLG